MIYKLTDGYLEVIPTTNLLTTIEQAQDEAKWIAKELNICVLIFETSEEDGYLVLADEPIWSI